MKNKFMEGKTSRTPSGGKLPTIGTGRSVGASTSNVIGGGSSLPSYRNKINVIC